MVLSIVVVTGGGTCLQVDDADPIFQFNGHQEEGFAMAWSPVAASKGQMLTGTCLLYI